MSLSNRLFNRVEPPLVSGAADGVTELVSGSQTREIDYILSGRPTQASGIWPSNLYPDEQPQSGVNPDET